LRCARKIAAYIAALEDAQAGHGSEGFDRLLYERPDATLEEYLRHAHAPTAASTPALQKPKANTSRPGC
jgi:hypothetical protein